MYFKGWFKEHQFIIDVKILFKSHTFCSFVLHVASIETPFSWPCCHSICIPIVKAYYDFDTHHHQPQHWSLDKRKRCFFFQPSTCTHFGHHFHAYYTSFWLASLPCFECFVHSRTSPLIVHHSSRSSLSLRTCVCSWLDICKKNPIENAPTQKPKYPLIHELKMLTPTHFWPIHEQVPPCLHVGMLHNISLQLLGVCKIVSMWNNSNNLSYAWIISPFHWHQKPLVALVSCFVVAFVLLTRLPQHYIRHRSMHVYKIIGGIILAVIHVHNYLNYEMHGTNMLHCMITLHKTNMV